MAVESQSGSLRETTLDLSVIVPVGQRVGDLAALLEEYRSALSQAGMNFEMIAVLDGPHHGLREQLAELDVSRPWLKIVELAREFGESAALTVALAEARGSSILTLPAYPQVIPAELLKILDAGRDADMAIAVRWPRAGHLLARVRRIAFHGLLRMLTGWRYRDLGCGVRLFRREIAEEIPIYGDRHHFYPVLASSRGFKVREVEVKQGPGDNFRSPHSVRRSLHRVLDILTLFFLVRFTKKPLRFFGTIGFLFSALGMLFLAILIVERLFFAVALADRPALLLSALLLVLGVQIFALGLIGELIIFTHARQLKEYAVRQVITAESADPADPNRAS